MEGCPRLERMRLLLNTPELKTFRDTLEHLCEPHYGIGSGGACSVGDLYLIAIINFLILVFLSGSLTTLGKPLPKFGRFKPGICLLKSMSGAQSGPLNS